MRQRDRGFTLPQIIIAATISGILAAAAYPAYMNYVRRGRLAAAYQALLDNARALEQHYAGHANFKKNSTTWADLPVQQTDYFCIKLQGNPRGTNSNSTYSLKAVALDKQNEPRVLTLNQDGTSLLCQSSSSECSEQNFFKNPARSDSSCVSYP